MNDSLFQRYSVWKQWFQLIILCWKTEYFSVIWGKIIIPCFPSLWRGLNQNGLVHSKRSKYPRSLIWRIGFLHWLITPFLYRCNNTFKTLRMNITESFWPTQFWGVEAPLFMRLLIQTSNKRRNLSQKLMKTPKYTC